MKRCLCTLAGEAGVASAGLRDLVDSVVTVEGAVGELNALVVLLECLLD